YYAPVVIEPLGGVAVSPLNGKFLLSEQLQLNTSPLNAVGGPNNLGTPTTLGAKPVLVYASGSVVAQPILDVTVATNPQDSVPDLLEARLSWNNGAFGSWVSFSSTGHSAGDTYYLALQVASAVTATDYYPFTIEVRATRGGNIFNYDPFNGKMPVVPLDSSSNAFGRGWGLTGLDQIVPVTSGVLWVYGGTGGARFFSGPISGFFVSPPNDFGSLV